MMLMRTLITTGFIALSSGLFSQCYMDRHNTSWKDAWISCQTTMSPNVERGVSHWIQYDLGYTYILGELHVWNINDPEHLDRGAAQVAIDTSTDGEEWTEQGIYFIGEGSGSSIYEGEDLMDFDNTEARYVLITVLENYGAQLCSGLSEIRAEVNGIITEVNESVSPEACFDLSIYPNPHEDLFFTRISSSCVEPMLLTIHDLQGRLVEERIINPADGEGTLLQLGNDRMEAGIYILSVSQGDAVGRYQVVKSR